MFEPGLLHIQHISLQPDDIGYDLKVTYELVQAPELAVHFSLQGEINGKSFEETFQLPKDMACNFASNLSRLAVKHGLPKDVNIVTQHNQYDAMFEDIRQQLHAKPGDPVKPEHLQ